jgi:orotidine-5'-phosphate decarboxylase
MLIRNPVILAADVDTEAEFFKILEQVGDLLGAVKIGPRLIVRYGSDIISRAAKIAPVFVDNKYFDIPSTMISAVRASHAAGASLVTVHALAGHEALRAMAELESELSRKRPFKILPVTVLTSFSPTTLPSCLKAQSPEALVKSLTDDIFASGLSSLVCSPHEAELIRREHAAAFMVCPGIRLEASGDLKLSLAKPKRFGPRDRAAYPRIQRSQSND